jgi:hypothetical protein
MPITTNLTKAKTLAHEMRRAKREEEFKPHDEVIMKQIPNNDATVAEAARQVIRDKYATIQTNINTAATVDELKIIVDSL